MKKEKKSCLQDGRDFEWKDCVPKSAKAKSLVRKVGELSRIPQCSSNGTLPLPKDGLSIFFLKADGSPAMLTFDGSTSPSAAALDGIKAAKPPLACDLDYRLTNVLASIVDGYCVKAELHKLVLKEPTAKFELIRAGGGGDEASSSSACVGTLVVALPLAHTGGNVIIRPASGKSGDLKFPTGSSELTWVASLKPHSADVGDVRSGQQLTLWYNLHRHEGVAPTTKRKRGDDPQKPLGDPKSSPLYWIFRELYEDDDFCPVAGCILGIPGTGDKKWADMVVEIAEAAGMGAKKVAVFSRYGGDRQLCLGEECDIPDYSVGSEWVGLTNANAVVWCRGMGSFKWEHEMGGKYYNQFEFARADAVMVVVPCLDKRRANEAASERDYDIILDTQDGCTDDCSFQYAFVGGDENEDEEEEDEEEEDE